MSTNRSFSYVTIVGDTLLRKLNVANARYFSTQVELYRLQENIHQGERQFLEVEHVLTRNIRAKREQEGQLDDLLHCQAMFTITIDQKSLSAKNQSLRDEIKQNERMATKLGEQKNGLSAALHDSTKTRAAQEEKSIELTGRNDRLSALMQRKRKEIEEEKAIKQDVSRAFQKSQSVLQHKQRTLSTHSRHNDRLQVRKHHRIFV